MKDKFIVVFFYGIFSLYSIFSFYFERAEHISYYKIFMFVVFFVSYAITFEKDEDQIKLSKPFKICSYFLILLVTLDIVYMGLVTFGVLSK